MGAQPAAETLCFRFRIEAMDEAQKSSNTEVIFQIQIIDSRNILGSNHGQLYRTSRHTRSLQTVSQGLPIDASKFIEEHCTLHPPFRTLRGNISQVSVLPL
jgi:hypothetical protein